jgi:hypothetical protein
MKIFMRSPSTKLRPATPQQRRDMIFVFGSNTSGIHGAGAARTALLQHGAVYGQGEGHFGDSYALPTKEAVVRPRKAGESGLQTLPYLTIAEHVDKFIRYARDNPKLKFQITRIGCGLAGLKDEHIAPLFARAPENCYFDSQWRPFLPERKGEPYKFWGTF